MKDFKYDINDNDTQLSKYYNVITDSLEDDKIYKELEITNI